MKPTRFEMAVLVIAAAIIVYVNFMPPLIGMADSGDFGRLLVQVGLDHVSPDDKARYFLYFNSKYRLTEPPLLPGPYLSSAWPVIRVARWLSTTAWQDQFFDIRVAAALWALIFLFGLWLVLIAARPLRLGLRTLLATLLIFIFTSIGYIAYFNSFYCEQAALCFLFVTIGCGLILAARRPGNAKQRAALLIGYFGAAGLTVTSKPQYAMFAPLLAAFGIYLATVTKMAKWWLSGTLVIVLCGIGSLYYFRTPRELRVDVAYIGVFMDLLPHSAMPREDLAALGLNPDFADLKGTTPYQGDSPLKTLEVRDEFLTNINSYSLPRFYLRRPARLYQLCRRAAPHAFIDQVGHLGYYEASTGKPIRAQAPRTWDKVREWFFPRSLFVILLFFASGGAAIVLYVKTRSEILRPLSMLYLLFVLMAIMSFFIPVLAQGEIDLEKHLWMFNLAFDACLILAVLGFAHWLVNLKMFGSRVKARPGSEAKSLESMPIA